MRQGLSSVEGQRCGLKEALRAIYGKIKGEECRSPSEPACLGAAGWRGLGCPRRPQRFKELRCGLCVQAPHTPRHSQPTPHSRKEPWRNLRRDTTDINVKLYDSMAILPLRERSSPCQQEQACHSQLGHGVPLLNASGLTEARQTRQLCGHVTQPSILAESMK